MPLFSYFTQIITDDLQSFRNSSFCLSIKNMDASNGIFLVALLSQDT